MNIERTLTLSGPVELGGAGAASALPTFVKYIIPIPIMGTYSALLLQFAHPIFQTFHQHCLSLSYAHTLMR